MKSCSATFSTQPATWALAARTMKRLPAVLGHQGLLLGTALGVGAVLQAQVLYLAREPAIEAGQGVPAPG